MAELFGNLWEYNLTRVVVVDVSDDYRLMQPPMPNDFYPVLREEWLPSYKLTERLARSYDFNGFLYDWHESPGSTDQPWYVGVVDEALARAEEELIEKARREKEAPRNEVMETPHMVVAASPQLDLFSSF